MLKRFGSSGLGGSPFGDEDPDPMAGVSNLSDAMLVLAVGIMLALIINWKIDVKVIHGDATVTSCYNTGNIVLVKDNASMRLGGITGFVNQKARIDSCYTTGEVYVTVEDGTAANNTSHAGFVGYATNANLVNLKNNYVLAGISPLDGTVSRLIGKASSVTEEHVKEISIEEMKAAGVIPNAILLILALDEADINDEEAVQTAKAAYNALSEEEKLLVSKELLEKLEKAETIINQMKQDAVEKQQADQQAADKVMELIKAIGDVSYVSGKAIQSVRQAYDELTKEQQALVTNISMLTGAESSYAAAIESLNVTTNSTKQASCNDASFVLTAQPLDVSDSFTYTYQWYQTDENGANPVCVAEGNTYTPVFTTTGEVYLECRITANDGANSFGVGTYKYTVHVKPETVALKDVENTTKGIKVTWNKAVGANGYYVLRKKGNGKWTKIATIKKANTVSYTDKKVSAKNGTKYSYTIQAYNGTLTGNYSEDGLYITRLTTPSISSVKNTGKKTMTVKWKKNSKATGYEIQYSTSKNFKKKITVKISKKNTASRKITKLKKSKKYYVRIRSYKKVGKTVYYSGWSNLKNLKITK